MRAQRPASGFPIADRRASPRALPFADDSFDAAMTTFSVHQWTDLDGGARRAAPGHAAGPIVILSGDPDALGSILAGRVRAPGDRDRGAAVSVARRGSADGSAGRSGSSSVPIPLDCTDGFGEAYYGRPEVLLDPGARRANSAWSFVDAETADALRRAPARPIWQSGEWDRRFGYLRTQPEFDGSLRLDRRALAERETRVTRRIARMLLLRGVVGELGEPERLEQRRQVHPEAAAVALAECRTSRRPGCRPSGPTPRRCPRRRPCPRRRRPSGTQSPFSQQPGVQILDRAGVVEQLGRADLADDRRRDRRLVAVHRVRRRSGRRRQLPGIVLACRSLSPCPPPGGRGGKRSGFPRPGEPRMRGRRGRPIPARIERCTAHESPRGDA